ncbi:hypothetical protein [Rhizobium straminoryzae]|uniref:DUF1127 domain-containing protein n=1 Tax=Rhizobium straminoryzae TaxID=1387186 RepID=A0A549TDB5_9HYPH|nr:hypothetical protein [Rhizobium straminoryzae]TRL40051.1 hypothetical protein FNA46_07210 [Rhizobium straminoryzae]
MQTKLRLDCPAKSLHAAIRYFLGKERNMQRLQMITTGFLDECAAFLARLMRLSRRRDASRCSNRLDAEVMPDRLKADIGMQDGRSDRSRRPLPTAFDAARDVWQRRSL